MGRQGISGADLIRAYVSLQKQGRNPTVVNLRLELGRGSYSTIAARLESLALLGRQGRYKRKGPLKGRGRPSAPVPTAKGNGMIST
jgi:hypothetical protein